MDNNPYGNDKKLMEKRAAQKAAGQKETAQKAAANSRPNKRTREALKIEKKREHNEEVGHSSRALNQEIEEALSLVKAPAPPRALPASPRAPTPDRTLTPTPSSSPVYTFSPTPSPLHSPVNYNYSHPQPTPMPTLQHNCKYNRGHILKVVFFTATIFIRSLILSFQAGMHFSFYYIALSNDVLLKLNVLLSNQDILFDRILALEKAGSTTGNNV